MVMPINGPPFFGDSMPPSFCSSRLVRDNRARQPAPSGSDSLSVAPPSSLESVSRLRLASLRLRLMPAARSAESNTPAASWSMGTARRSVDNNHNSQ